MAKQFYIIYDCSSGKYLTDYNNNYVLRPRKFCSVFSNLTLAKQALFKFFERFPHMRSHIFDFILCAQDVVVETYRQPQPGGTVDIRVSPDMLQDLKSYHGMDEKSVIEEIKKYIKD